MSLRILFCFCFVLLFSSGTQIMHTLRIFPPKLNSSYFMFKALSSIFHSSRSYLTSFFKKWPFFFVAFMFISAIIFSYFSSEVRTVHVSAQKLSWHLLPEFFTCVCSLMLQRLLFHEVVFFHSCWNTCLWFSWAPQQMCLLCSVLYDSFCILSLYRCCPSSFCITHHWINWSFPGQVICRKFLWS